MAERGIAWRRHRLTAVRSDKARELMRDYDRTVYDPAMAALRAECAAAGHGELTYERNGLGWGWTQCCACGGRVEEWREGPLEDEP